MNDKKLTGFPTCLLKVLLSSMDVKLHRKAFGIHQDLYSKANRYILCKHVQMTVS